MPYTAQFDGIYFEETERGHQREERRLRLSDFKLIGILGEGRFGNVILAIKKSTGGHSSSEELFALKFVPNKLVSKIEKEVFIRAVGHPFLVQLLSYFQTKEALCYVMEYLEGSTLCSLLSILRFSEDLTQI